jgi:hypothetical protein
MFALYMLKSASAKVFFPETTKPRDISCNEWPHPSTFVFSDTDLIYLITTLEFFSKKISNLKIGCLFPCHVFDTCTDTRFVLHIGGLNVKMVAINMRSNVVSHTESCWVRRHARDRLARHNRCQRKKRFQKRGHVGKKRTL